MSEAVGRNGISAGRKASLATASLLALVVATAGVGMAGAARAQDAAAPASAEEVVVTGTRLNTTGFTTPTPVTVLSARDMENLNITNVGAGITELPEFKPTNNPATNGFGSFNVGAQIANLLGLGVNRTLVLEDGNRLPPVTREQTFDLNQIPSLLVSRTDVVVGGASAAYGSDAIAGVVNIILDHKLNQLKFQADYGISQYGDGADYHIALADGHDFAGGKGHFIFGGEYDDQNVIGSCLRRTWCVPNQVVTNAGADAVAGQTAFVRADSNAGYFANQNGVISIINNNTPATAGIRNLFGTNAVSFTATGTPIAYSLGAPGSGNSVIGGNYTPSQAFTQIMVPTQRGNFLAHADYDFNPHLHGYVEGSYAHVYGITQQTVYFGTPVQIFADNPYIPAALRAVIGAAPAVASGTRPSAAADAFNLAILGPKQGQSASGADSYRVSFGLNGDFMDNRIRWDAHYQYAHTTRDQSVANDLVTGAGRVLNNPTSLGISDPGAFDYFQWATDVVASPGGAGLPTAGTPICRALISPNPALVAAAQGCVPYNPFGTGAASQAALNYVYRTLEEQIQLEQHAAAANVQADLFHLPAGPVSAAAGVEFRHDDDALTHDYLSTVFAYFQNFGANYNAGQNVYEGYLEVQAPLLKDMPLAKALNLDGAVREAHYDISGNGSYAQVPASSKLTSTTWKVGLVYDPVDWFRFRLSRSHDFRAPNLYDQFQASASTFTSVVNRWAPGTPSQFPSILAGGNPKLAPELADTSTFGVVFRPHGLLDGFQFSADYIDVKVNGYIAASGAQTLVDQCYYDNNTQACGLIHFAPGNMNTITEIDNTNLNLQWLRTRVLDVEADYRTPLAKFFTTVPGDLTLRLVGTDTLESSTNLFGVVTDQAGANGSAGTPRWIVNLYGTYTLGPATLTMTGRYISPGVFDATKYGPGQTGYSLTATNGINNNYVEGAFYVNMNASYNIIDRGSERMQLFLQINNLFDKNPPSDPQSAYTTNPVYYDQIGRYFRMGLRLTY